MGIGIDLREVLDEVGVGITILRSGGSVSGEYIDIEPNSQVTKPFIREYFLEATFPDDTSGIVGDIVEFNPTRTRYLLMNKSPAIFENSIYGYDAVLYKCNVSGQLVRPSGEVWPSQTYHKTMEWEVIESECFGLQTEPLFGHDLETEEEIGLLGIERHELYVPSSVGIQVHDRFEPVSGEFYRVETFRKRRFSNVDIVELAEDTR